MRPIDADALIDKYQRENGVDVYRYNVIQDLADAPTVDAIPVEWMRQFKETPVTDESAKRCDECGGDFVEWMILEWKERKEE